MYEQSDDGRRQAGPSNTSGLQQGRLRCVSNLGQSPVNLTEGETRDLIQGPARVIRVLGSERRQLRRRELIAPCVRTQTVEASGSVKEVVAQGSGAARAHPHAIPGKTPCDSFDVFARLEQRVRDGHEERWIVRQRSAQPYFCHRPSDTKISD
jgi:hypothetical protein